jgi:hypothetical protein
MKRGRDPDLELQTSFKRIRTPDQSDKALCQHCDWSGSWQTSQIRNHLHKNCVGYRRISPQLTLDRSISITRPLSQPAEQEFKRSIAFSCYFDNLPFSSFEQNRAIRESYLKLNPTLRFPTRREISTTLLDAQYDITSNKVNGYITSEPFLNISIDETTDICYNRIQNICVNTPSYGAFYQFSESLEGRTMDAIQSAKWAIEAMERVKGTRPWTQLNSLVTDTCPAQLNAWFEISRFQDLKHLFIVGCDSHGLQLLIKDIIEMPQSKSIFTQAQEIVQAFSHSPKQLGILRQYMINSLGGIKSFALSVMTRWGSQVRMLQSLQRAKLALKVYYTLLPVDAGKSIRKHQSLIHNENWWESITNLLKILDPINEAIKMSESDKANLHYVIPRWKRLWKHLDQHQAISMEAFEKRFKRQTNDCHLMAYLLNPATVGDDEIPGYINWHERAYAFFVHRQIEPVSALKELNEFRGKTGRFYPKLWCWELAKDAGVFWNSATTLAPTIGPIAIRLISTPATSVPSERAFSILNLVHTKLRNRLSIERVDKLQYIYINERVLRKIKTSYNVQMDTEAEADVDTEDLFVELEDNLIGAQNQ